MPIIAKSGQASRPPFVPSVQQAVFLRNLADGDSHILLEARAGSGKSTTCREGAWSLGRRKSIYCCFNKHIATEFQRDLPHTCRAATMHALGFQLINNALGKAELDKDGEKVDRIAESYFPNHAEWAERRAVSKLVSQCKNRLDDGMSVPALLEIAALSDIEIPDGSLDDVLAVVPDVLDACRDDHSVIDFDDMIWLPVERGLFSPVSPDVLFVDEAQDLNPCQHALIDSLNPKGRTIVVGDRWQSIYAFRGADPHSITGLESKLGFDELGLNSYPLTITRRCPRSVVEMAKTLVPDLEAMPAASEGYIESVKPQEWASYVRPGSMILCRTNAPLVSACYQLLRCGVKAVIQGRDIGQGLLTLIARLRPRDVGGLLRAIGDYWAREVEKLSKLRNPGGPIQALTDRCDCLRAMCDGAGSIDEVKARISKMFSDLTDENSVTLSSIHRSKGLERDHVVILRPDLIPGPWSRTAVDRQQERNLAYVAITRSRKRLTFCGDVPAILGG